MLIQGGARLCFPKIKDELNGICGMSIMNQTLLQSRGLHGLEPWPRFLSTRSFKHILGKDLTIYMLHGEARLFSSKGSLWLADNLLLQYQAVLLERTAILIKTHLSLNPTPTIGQLSRKTSYIVNREIICILIGLYKTQYLITSRPSTASWQSNSTGTQSSQLLIHSAA